MNNYFDNDFEDELLLLEGENNFEFIQKLESLIENKITSIGTFS